MRSVGGGVESRSHSQPHPFTPRPRSPSQSAARSRQPAALECDATRCVAMRGVGAPSRRRTRGTRATTKGLVAHGENIAATVTKFVVRSRAQQRIPNCSSKLSSQRSLHLSNTEPENNASGTTAISPDFLQLLGNSGRSARRRPSAPADPNENGLHAWYAARPQAKRALLILPLGGVRHRDCAL